MAFALNQSAFGAKPAATTTSLFGQPQQQQQPQASAFGAGLANAPPLGSTQPSLFGGFGQPNQQQPAQQNQPTTSLFGQPQQPQQAATGSLFGQPQQQQPAASGSLFGQPQQQQSGTTGGLFGQPQQPQATTTTGGLFGQTQPAASGSLFGQPAQTQPGTTQQQPSAPGSLFGGSLFGNAASNPLQTQTTQPGAFGQTSTTASAPFGGFGGSIFGNKSQQPQPQQQPSLFGQPNQSNGLGAFGQPAPNSTLNNGPVPFTKSTKFNDLPDDIKKVFEVIDTQIQQRVQICKDLQSRKLGAEPTRSQEAMRNIQKELVNTATTIRNDLHVTQDLKTKVDQAVEDTIIAMRVIDGFRNPQSGNTYLKDHAGFPLDYFTRVMEQNKQRLAWYKATIEQIERKLVSATNSIQTPQSISATLQAQHATFLSLASKTAAIDTELHKIKTLYTQLWRAKTGSVRDPFNDGIKPEKSGDLGLGGLTLDYNSYASRELRTLT